MKINDIFHKPTRNTLKIIIAILSTAIIVLALLFLNKNYPSLFNDFFQSSSSTATESSAQPIKNGPTVIIDAGHGGWEPGAGKGSINEKDIVLDISLEIEKRLKEKNIDYYMIRNDDTYVSLEDRVKIANEKACKLFVSIHNNSFTDSAQGGILTTYNPSSPIGKDIAEIMQSKISDIGMRNREVVPRPNLYVLRYTNMPSILLEIGFISNKKDLKLLTDASFQRKCADRIVLGIEEIVSKYITDAAENSAEN